ncbi:uncharacterized protein FFM5_15363 [Fusarium fujikuroi]|nr:uncharacterized protein FFM5_15363 [Fusarium fujikuroi]
MWCIRGDEGTPH